MILEFGKHTGKSFKNLESEDPQYLLWLAGITSIATMKLDPKGAMYDQLKVEHPNTVAAAKDWVNSKCRRCWNPIDPDQVAKHLFYCKVANPKQSHYHYHPYGKR